MIILIPYRLADKKIWITLLGPYEMQEQHHFIRAWVLQHCHNSELMAKVCGSNYSREDCSGKKHKKFI